MPLSPFEKDRAITQGRLPAGNAPDGAFVVELGHVNFEAVRLALGDYVELTRTVTLDPQAAVVRVRVQLVSPPELPAGFAWELSARLNGTVLTTRRIVAGARVRDLHEVAVSTATSNRPATDTLAFRLTVVSA